MDHDTREGLKYVEAVLNHLVDTGEKPVIYLYPPPPGIPQRTGRYTTATVPICDGRALLPQLSLDKPGFLLQRHETREARLQRRFVEINVWRPIQGPVEDTPLGWCATDKPSRSRTSWLRT